MKDSVESPTHYVRPNWLTETSLAFVDTTSSIGKGSSIWHFARILQGVRIGRDCSIGGGTEIGRGSTIGDASRVGANVFVPPNSIIGHHVFVGPGVIFTDDMHPRVPLPGDPPYHAQPPVIDDYAVIGAGAVILPGVHVGEGARVAAGAIVTKDVPAGAMVRSAPARFRTMPDAWMHVAPIAATG